jgi:hypothetical protein
MELAGLRGTRDESVVWTRRARRGDRGRYKRIALRQNICGCKCEANFKGGFMYAAGVSYHVPSDSRDYSLHRDTSPFYRR